MSDKIELLPCPFCGGKAHWPEPEVNIHYVGCMSCAACATGVEDWNRRAAIDQQPAPAVPAGWKLVPAKPTTDMCNAAAEATGYDDYHGAYVGYIAMLAAAPAAPVAQEPVAWQVRNGVVTHGFYRSEAEASEVAFDMQKAHNLGGSLAAFNVRPVYTAQTAADQPDTVAVPRELLAEAESIIESYAEALKASHAPGGDWEGEEAAHDEYELEEGVASKLRALLRGGEA